MTIITKLLAAGLLTWLGLLALIVILRMLRREIAVYGLLLHRLEVASGAIAPERAVAMIAFPFVLGLYTLDALHADVTGMIGRPSLPDVPNYLLTLLTGGNGLYLAGKIARST